MHRRIPNDTMPTDFFCRQTLELSFRVLRYKNPDLAQAIKNVLDKTICVEYSDLHSQFTGEMLLNSHIITYLNPHTIGQIVYQLTNLGSEVLSDAKSPPNHSLILKAIIEDWVSLTEWILSKTREDDSDKTAYH